MTKQQLIEKLNDIEWEDFEVKLAKGGVPKSAWESVSAFSNTAGGWLIFGVEEKSDKNAGSYPKPIEYFLSSDTSIPRNPILAKLFRVVKLAENAGYGFDKMIDGWKTYISEPIKFNTDLDTSVTTFYLEQNSDQASDQAILIFCKDEKSMQEIMEFTGMKHKSYFRKNILKPLIDKGLIELTIPDKPKSPKQKYCTNLTKGIKL